LQCISHEHCSHCRRWYWYFTYKLGLERYYEGYDDDNDINNKIRFEVYTYNNPLAVLSEFKPNFYDLLLMDINIPNINGFELCQKILELDVNVRVCFISAGEVNIEALREISKCKHEMFYQETSFNRLFGQRLSAVRIVIALEAI